MTTTAVITKPQIPDACLFENRQKKLQEMLDQRTLKTPDQGSAIDTFKTILTTSLGFIPKTGGYISGATDVFFTYLIENDKAINNSVKAYREMLIDIIDKSITAYDDAAIRASIFGFALSLKDFQSHVLNLRKNPNQEPLKQMVRIAFMNLESDLDCKYLYECTKQKYLAEELPMYTYFATAHLSLLREVNIYGANWGFDKMTISHYEVKFDSRIVSYIDHCKEAYKDGVTKIKQNTKNSAYVYDQWNAINRYRNVMVTTVFDFINLWWLFNPDLPKDSGAYVEYCRILQSDLYGATYAKDQYDHNLNGIENYFEKNDLYQYKNELYKLVTSDNGFRLNSIQPFLNTSDTTWGTNLTAGNLVQGKTDASADTKVENVWTQNKNTTKVKVCHDILPRYFEFLDGEVTPNRFGMEVGYQSWYPHINQEDVWYDSHKPSNKGDGGKIETVTIEGHRVVNIFGTYVNDSYFLTADTTDPSTGSSWQIGNSDGAITGVGISFIPLGVSERNIIYGTATTVIDPQKYLYSPAPTNIDFIADGVFPGAHQLSLKTDATVSYNFDPYDSTLNKFKIILKISAKADGKITLTDKNKVSSTFAWKGEQRSFLFHGNETQFTLNQTPGSNIFNITVDTTTSIELESIIFVPIPPAKK